jgi:DNA invertase Pin-like site-specific DNA recombinase
MNTYAYIRRSSPLAEDYTSQRDAVLALAARHGDTPEVVEERGRSGASARVNGKGYGTGRGGKRPGWDEVRERISAGGVSVVYAYSLSRLARSAKDLLSVAEDCAANGTTLRLVKDGEHDFGTASGRMFVGLLAVIAGYEAEVASEYARDRVARKRANGEHVGRTPFGKRLGADGRLVEDDAAQAVIAYAMRCIEEEGGYQQAARRLNEEGVGGKPWNGLRLQRLAGKAGRSGRTYRYTTRAFTRLLTCTCGRLLVAHQNKPGSDWVGWYCHGAMTDSTHPRPHSIPDAKVKELLKTEAALLRLPYDRVEVAEEATAALAALDEQRGRLASAVAAGVLTVDDVRAEVERIEAERQRLAVRASIEDVPQAVDWEQPPEVINEVLHALWESVTVDTAHGAVVAEWRDPSLRHAVDSTSVE